MIDFDEWYRRFMPSAMRVVAYTDAAETIAGIVHGGLVLAGSAGLSFTTLKTQFARHMAVEDFETILIGLEEGGRLRRKGDRIYAAGGEGLTHG